MKSNIVLDIETIADPVDPEDVALAMLGYEPPSNYKSEEAIARHRANFEATIREKIDRRYSFGLGRKRMVSCAVGYSYPGEVEPVQIECWISPDPTVIVKELTTYLDGAGEFKLITWNGPRFDIPELIRSLSLVGEPLLTPLDPRDIVDLKRYFDVESTDVNRTHAGLKEIAAALGAHVPDTRGDDVAALWRDGKLDEIREYNISDIKLTHHVWRAVRRLVKL